MPGREQCLYLHVNRACTYTWTGLVPTRERGLCLDVSRLCPSVNVAYVWTWTVFVPTREQGLYLYVNRACTHTWTGSMSGCEPALSLRKRGLCLDVNSVCTYTWTGLVRIREQGLCEQGLCPHDRKLSGGMFVAMSGKLFEFSEVSGVTGRRASSVVSG